MVSKKWGILMLSAGVIVSSMAVFAAKSNTANQENLPYVNGYTIGESLSKYYRKDEREAFIKGLLVGLGEQKGKTLSQKEIKQTKETWFKQGNPNGVGRYSYLLGYYLTTKPPIKDWQVNPFYLTQGIWDGIQVRNMKALNQEIGTGTLYKYFRAVANKNKGYLDRWNEKSIADGDAFLTKNAKKPGVNTFKNGVQYKIIEQGNGQPANVNDTVQMDIVSKKIDGTVVYESEKIQQAPITIKVSEAAKVWQDALFKMKPGAVWELYVPADLSTGTRNPKDSLWPKEVLIYTINLKSVNRS